MVWLGAPDQGAGSSPLRPLGRNGEEIELTIILFLRFTFFMLDVEVILSSFINLFKALEMLNAHVHLCSKHS
jgi:hypothetical protein